MGGDTRSKARENWLRKRKNGIGASESSAVIGVNPWRSPLDVWAEKRGLTEPQAESEAMEAGNYLEPTVARWFSERTGIRYTNPGKWRMWWHPRRLPMFATPDRIIPAMEGKKGPGCLQIKTTGAHKAEEWDDGVPLLVQVQEQHEMACTGYEWAIVAVLIGGNKLRWAEVERDGPFIKDLEKRVVDFWKKVESGDEPAVGANDKEVLSKLYPESNGSVIDLPVSLITEDEKLQALKAQLKDLKADISVCENKIKQAIGDADMGVLPSGVSYTFKSHTRRAYTVEETVIRQLRRKSS
jgi:putative phage-type endonuclease